MRAIAERARHQPDVKTRHLIDWIRAHQCPALPPFGERPTGEAPAWNNRRVLVFTENREGTKRYLRAMLEQAIEHTQDADARIEVIDGLAVHLHLDQRVVQRLLARFRAQGFIYNDLSRACLA